jgi:hypothetical protein
MNTSWLLFAYCINKHTVAQVYCKRDLGIFILYVMLCYVMLCYVMLCYVMLCYVMLRPSGHAV